MRRELIYSGLRAGPNGAKSSSTLREISGDIGAPPFTTWRILSNSKSAGVFLRR